MKDEIDRYKRLLEDWQGDKTPPAKGVAAPPTPPPPSKPAAAAGGRAKLSRPAPAPPPEQGRYPSGAIVVINDEDLVIYRRPVAGKPFDMVYSLLADGTAKIEAIDMNGQQIHEMGIMPERHFKRLQSEMRWTRSMVAEGCTNAEDAERVPDPGEPAAEAGGNGSSEPDGPLPQIERHTPPPMERNTPPPMRRPADSPAREESAGRAPQPKTNKLKRGQKFTVMFGNKAWEAVYWGRDTSGSVVAHNTHKHWALMHLDLDRFKDTIVLQDEPDPGIVEAISRDLATLADFE